MKGSPFKLLISAGLLSTMIVATSESFAGNKDRVGQAGANELLINPWARSSGLGGSNISNVVGLEALHLNVSGLAFTRKTEVMFARTRWLGGSGIGINSFGFTQRVGEQGVIGVGVMSMDFGDIDITTVNLPEGGSGTYSPQFINLGLSYAREFSNSIYGGLTVKTISESIADATARGVAFDAGIRYVTGEQDQIKFGIALKNVGPRMQFDGDGFAQKVTLDDKEFTVEHRTEPFELPSLLNIGASYDYYIAAKPDSTGKTLEADHRLTGSGTFTSNSFGKDQLRFGIEYGFRKLFMIRGGYVYEAGNFSKNVDEHTNAHRGLAAGATIAVPLGKNGNTFDLDYSWRESNPFGDTHTVGIRINI